MRQHARPVCLAIVLSLLLAGLAASPSQSQPTSSQIDLRAKLTLVGDPAVPCPPGSPNGLMCPLRTGVGSAPGLGTVTEAYTFLHWVGPPKCDGDSAQALAYPVRWIVANKGELDFALAESGCVGDNAGGIGGSGRRSLSPAARGSTPALLEAAMSTLVSEWAPTASFMEVKPGLAR